MEQQGMANKIGEWIENYVCKKWNRTSVFVMRALIQFLTKILKFLPLDQGRIWTKRGLGSSYAGSGF